MKFLKTFLFTISLTFISFGVVTLRGFCASIALTPDSTGLQTIQGGTMPSYYTFAPAGEMYLMNNPFVIDDMYYSVDNWLQTNTGYDIEHAYQMGIDGTVFTDTSILNTSVADALASKLSQGALTAQAIANTGYRVFSHSAQQWGANAKEWFLGQYDSATNKITNVASNIVTKITAEGLANYSSLYDSQVQNDTVQVIDKFKSCIYGKEYICRDNNGVTYQISLPVNCFFAPTNINGSSTLCVCIKESEWTNWNGTLFYLAGNDFGVKVNSNGPSKIEYAYVYTSSFGQRFQIGNEWYYIGAAWFGSSIYFGNNDYYFFSSADFKSYVENLLSGSSSVAIGSAVGYSSSSSLALQNILNQLIDKYVDSDTLNSINEKLQEGTITYVTDSNNELVAEVELSPNIFDDIQDLVDEAIETSALYQELIAPYEVDEPVPEPEPIPDYTGIAVPEDFPTTIFSPINDSVGSVFNFVSIFEPIFYIFSFSAGLLGLWLVVPFVVLFMFLFRLLK